VHEDKMKATQTEIPMPTQGDAIMAQTLGKIYKIVLNPGVTVAESVLDDAKLQQLMRYLLAAPEALLPSC
jgi:hypothetical protein